MLIDTNHSAHLRELFGERFEWVNTESCTGVSNMEFDESRVRDFANGNVLPMFRVYGWKPWAVSLGFHQRAETISQKKCDERGIDIVRRITGGRAVLHASELTYSVVTQVNHPQNQYRIIHELLFDVFKPLCDGSIEFTKSNHEIQDIASKSSMSNKACFTSKARYELHYRGKKFVGSAQRIIGNVLLQHGSILLDNSHEEIVYLTDTNNPEEIEMAKKELQNKSTSLSSIVGRPVSWSECALLLQDFLRPEGNEY